ncbi:MAG: ABC transporter ATP-binding protein [Actinomycetes bacterium]
MMINTNFTAHRGEFTLTLNAQFEAGTVVAILGPNGAGKSTLLRSLAGLTAIDTGSIVIDGVTVDDARNIFVSPPARSVGFVFQDYALFPHLTVLANIAFGPRSRGGGRKASNQIADEVLAKLGIAELADRKPGSLSGGQAQRVALARALATKPDVLLLDEPLAALDVETRAQVRLHLSEQLETFSGCTILVTHDPLDAMLLADRVIVLENGAIVQDATPVEIARRPATPYAAALIGVTLLRGNITRGELTLEAGGTLYSADLGAVGPVLAVIRPESVSVHRVQPEGSPRNVWPGTIMALEASHDRVRVQVAGPPAVVAAVTPGAVAELGLAPGTRVWLSVKAVDLDVYPTHLDPTGAR